MCGHAEQQYRFDDGWVVQQSFVEPERPERFDIPSHLMRRECLLVQGHIAPHGWGLWRKT